MRSLFSSLLLVAVAIAVTAPLASAALRVKVVSVYSDDPNAPQSFRVGAIKVKIGDVEVTTGDDTDALKCVSGTKFRLLCASNPDCPGGVCTNPGDNDGDGHDEEELGIARTTIEPGTHVVGIPETDLRDELGNKYRVGSIRIEETVTALGQLCAPAAKPEGNVSYEFNDDVDHSSQSDYTIAIRIVPLAAPAFTGGSKCVGDGNSTKALLKCKRTVLNASSDQFEARLDALADCAAKKRAGKLAANVDCLLETKTRDRILKATAKLDKAIDKACGGADKTCGGDTANEFTPKQLGFATTCPGLHGQCKTPLATCSDVAACLACINATGTKELLDLFTVVGNADPATQKQLHNCQQTMTKAMVTASLAQSKLTAKCGAQFLKDGPGSQAPCLKTFYDDYDEPVRKMDKAICKACGGREEKGCGGPDDLSVSAIGFPATCPDVAESLTVPCSRPIQNLPDVILCARCRQIGTGTCVGSAGLLSVQPQSGDCQ